MGGRNKGSGAIDKGQANYAGQYTIETVEFWMIDGRVQILSDRARIAVLYLGLISTCERRECLPNWCTWSHVGRLMGVSTRLLGTVMSRVKAEVFKSTLIDETADGRIIVCGARNRRKNLRWKDEGNIEGINGYKNHQAVSIKQETLKGAIAPGSESPKEKREMVQLPNGQWVVKIKRTDP